MTFRYLRDPLFLACVAAYLVNRFAIKPFVHGGFSHESFNDLVCIPFWVPIMLWMQRRMHLRTDDAPPRAYEIVIPLILWSALFEIVLPSMHWFKRPFIADPWDIAYYAFGAMLAMYFWRWWYLPDGAPPAAAHPPQSHTT